MHLIDAYLSYPVNQKIYQKEGTNMRIVAGIYKSRTLKAPNGMTTRPTSDKVKESLFNILGNRIENATCLDLFAGSGNLGLEAISRGASFCYFVDNNHEAIRIINDNIKTLNINNRTKVLHLDYLKALKVLDVSYDIIFLDPPYRYDVFNSIMDYLISNNKLKDKAVIFYECDGKKEFEIVKYLDMFDYKEYQYGQTKLYVFLKK